MSRAAPGRRAIIEDFPVVLDGDIARRAAGGRRHLRETTARLDVSLGGGLVVPVELRRRPGRFDSPRWVFVCVMCGRDVMKLRRIDEAPWLACKWDLVTKFAAKYAAQVRRSRAGFEALPALEGADHANPV